MVDYSYVSGGNFVFLFFFPFLWQHVLQKWCMTAFSICSHETPLRNSIQRLLIKTPKTHYLPTQIASKFMYIHSLKPNYFTTKPASKFTLCSHRNSPCLHHIFTMIFCPLNSPSTAQNFSYATSSIQSTMFFK